jgi:hypothetical protein
MNNHQDIDMKLKRTFDKIRISEQKVDAYIVEPYLNRKNLEEISKAEKERKTIIIMASLAAFLFNISIMMFIGIAIALPFWAILLLASVFSIVGLSVIILFLTLNKFYTNKEAIY